ncbi:type II toxin-antitoxin system MqsA family antitoxin [Candidatus Poribacteria bacterium]|nr:type II toxin-antitoxin system MqsA family antitoxin [Candidatus Poribacteria bacterium]
MRCVACKIGETIEGTTSLTYTRPSSKLQVVVSAVPADVCPRCGEAYLSEAVAQEIFELVDGILELGKWVVGKVARVSSLNPERIEYQESESVWS